MDSLSKVFRCHSIEGNTEFDNQLVTYTLQHHLDIFQPYIVDDFDTHVQHIKCHAKKGQPEFRDIDQQEFPVWLPRPPIPGDESSSVGNPMFLAPGHACSTSNYKNRNYDGLELHYGDFHLDIPTEIKKYDEALKTQDGDRFAAMRAGHCRHIEYLGASYWFPRSGRAS